MYIVHYGLSLYSFVIYYELRELVIHYFILSLTSEGHINFKDVTFSHFKLYRIGLFLLSWTAELWVLWLNFSKLYKWCRKIKIRNGWKLIIFFLLQNFAVRFGGMADYRALSNNIDTKAKCRHLKNWPVKRGSLRQVFIRVILEMQSVMVVFSTQLCELLPLTFSLVCE